MPPSGSPKEIRAEESPAPAAQEKLNVLLVDDQPQRLLSYEAILSPLGENLLRAGSGREALEILLKQEVAVLLVDVVMPEMDGFEMAGLIRRHPRFQSVPIIFVTAVSTSEMERLKGYELGAVDYVCVPIVAEILRAKVAVFLELHRKTRELKNLNRHLEQRVSERTSDLEKALTVLETHTSKLEEEIAQRRRLESELRQQAAQLAEADRRKDEFLAMLGHELRNPLAPIQSAVEMMKLRALDDPALERARDIVERQVHHMTRLLDDLLDVARITRGKIRLAKEPIELAVIVAQAVETCRPLIEARQHRLSVGLPADAVWLAGDATRLVQVVANLLHNAAKYTEPGGQIWLAGERDGGEVVVRVRDTGVGIAADMVPRVFDLFVQAVRAPDRSEGGLGIGLTLVRRLVEMHGGTVAAESAGLGRGSEFVVRLPALVAPPAQARNGAPQDARAARPLRVLVVEDNVEVAESLGMLLEILGHQAHLVHTGPAAVEAAGGLCPDVVLVDIGLPGMDGYEVARHLRRMQDGGQLALIAVSGYGRDEDLARSKAAGFDEHLVKPVTSRRLQAAMACRIADSAQATT
ncbi:MAG: response regulator [Planctomycetia bacterium]|nr:response regulator [Planctomycetia bacterium]